MGLPLRFVVTGVIAVVTTVVGLVFRPDLLATYHYNQYILAATHLLVLGGLLSIVMGAMYQLVPVALEVHLHSERLGRWQYFCHLIGFAGLVWMFWVWNMKQVGHFGSLLALGVGLFVYNLARTLARVRRRDLIWFTVAAALAWLSLTVLAGLYLAASKSWTFSPFPSIGAMHAHAHVGGLGVFILLIVGVSYKLMPMFLLGEIQSPRRAAASLVLLNLAVLGLLVTLTLQSAWKLAFALVAGAGIICYLIELRAVVRARQRRPLDWGVRYFLTAMVLLIPLAGLALVLCWPGLPATAFTTQLENVYGAGALLGVVGLAILGMLYKILPFLVWLKAYVDHIGKTRVPSLADMYSPRLQAVGFWLFLVGLTALLVTTAVGHSFGVRLSAIILLAALAVFGANVLRILSHAWRPRVNRVGSRPPRPPPDRAGPLLAKPTFPPPSAGQPPKALLSRTP